MPHTHLTGGRSPRRQTIPTPEFLALVRSLGWSQERLAEILGVTSRSIRYWMAGTRHPPKGVVFLLRILAAQQRQRGRSASA